MMKAVTLVSCFKFIRLWLGFVVYNEFDLFAERCNYLNRKNGFKRQRSLRDYPFKKRKLYDCSSVSNSDESITGDGMHGVSENGANEDGLGSGPTLPGGSKYLPPFNFRHDRHLN